jgi:hypothetical protein
MKRGDIAVVLFFPLAIAAIVWLSVTHKRVFVLLTLAWIFGVLSRVVFMNFRKNR